MHAKRALAERRPLILLLFVIAMSAAPGLLPTVALASDDCGNPTTIPLVPFSDFRDTSIDTTAVSDPVHSCTGLRDSKSVWYRFTPSLSRTIRVSTAGSAYDTVVTVYTGTCSAPTELGCSDNT